MAYFFNQRTLKKIFGGDGSGNAGVVCVRDSGVDIMNCHGDAKAISNPNVHLIPGSIGSDQTKCLPTSYAEEIHT